MKHHFLNEPRGMPHKGPDNRIVHWHVFRHPEEADDYVHHIVLGAGQRLVGGFAQDSVGGLWWVGVEVDDLTRWGNRAAVHKHAE
ncbi:MAG: hypothetical protein M0037_05785 [Betaproteobacteria bacterium]|nr:hypothetical protein [Betaproteobacteria bacterium]